MESENTRLTTASPPADQYSDTTASSDAKQTAAVGASDGGVDTQHKKRSPCFTIPKRYVVALLGFFGFGEVRFVNERMKVNKHDCVYWGWMGG